MDPQEHSLNSPETNSSEQTFNLLALQQKPRRIKRQNKIKIELAKTQYPLLRTVATNELGWRVWTRQQSKEEINLYWFDTYVHDEFVRKLRPYQRVNHFPGSQCLGKKNLLSNSINRMKKISDQQYDFFPNTFVFPADIEEFQRFSSQQQNRFYIVKPCSDCQGRGIFLTKRPDYNSKEELVVQQYIQNPLLLQKTKFDLRVYVLIRSITPLKIYIYDEGLSRLATCDYEKPLSSNQRNMRMHLTNYAINKLSPNFIFNKSETQDDIGHKRSYTSTMKALKDLGCDIIWLQGQIDKMIVKTLICVQQTLSKRYKDIRESRQELQSVCFEVLGFDILIDQDFKPFLLEVNHSPSFCAETPLDLVIKKHLLLDTLNLLNLNHQDKINYLKSRNQQDNIHSHQIMKTYAKHQLKDVEPQQTGAFRKIYPLENAPLNQQTNRLYERLFKLSKTHKISPAKAMGPIPRGYPFSNQKIDKIRDTTDSISQHDNKSHSFYNALHNVKRTKLKQLKQAIQFQQLIPVHGQLSLKQETLSNIHSIDANPELSRLQKQEVLIYQSTIKRDKQRERRKYISPMPVNNINIRLDDRFSHRVKDHKASPAEVQTPENRFKIHSMFSTTIERKKHRDQSNKTASNWFRQENSNEEKFRVTDRFLGKYSYSIELKQKIERMQMARLRIQKVRKIDKASCILVKSSSPEK